MDEIDFAVMLRKAHDELDNANLLQALRLALNLIRGLDERVTEMQSMEDDEDEEE